MTANLLRFLCASIYNEWSLTLVGNRARIGDVTNEDMRRVEVGRVVMERSTIWHADRDEARIGRLLRVEVRPTHTPEEWLALGETDVDDIPEDRHWIIEPLMHPGTEYDWTNADFLAVPEGLLCWDGHGEKFCWRKGDGAEARASVPGEGKRG